MKWAWLIAIYLIFNSQMPHAEVLQPPDPPAPRFLYHFGNKTYLLKDILAHTVPQEDWDAYIMGDKTRFQLPDWRRGLYGSNPALAAVAYGDSLVATQETPWLMRIQISDQCLTHERLLQFSPWSIYRDKNFVTWFKAHEPTTEFQSFVDKCYPLITGGFSPKNYFRMPDLGLYGVTNPPPPKRAYCEQIVGAALSELHIGVVRDNAWEESWYIRDHACIQDIQGMPQDVLKWMSKDPDFWNPKNLGSPLSEESESDEPEVGSSYLMILLDALKEHSDFEDVKTPKMILRNLERFSTVNSVFADDAKALRALLKCQKRNRVTLFRNLTKHFNDALKKLKYNPGKQIKRAYASYLEEVSTACNAMPF